jgi:hypothetical protein
MSADMICRKCEFVTMRKIARDLTPEQSGHLRQLIEDELFPLIPRQYQLAAILGIAQGNFSRFLDGERGGTMAMAFQIAFLLNRAVEDVLGIPPMPTFTDQQERRYPTRILAARAAYLDGVPVSRIVPVLGALLKYEGDPGIEWWMKMMRSKALAMPGSKEETAHAIEVVAAGLNKAKAKKAKRARLGSQRR